VTRVITVQVGYLPYSVPFRTDLTLVSKRTTEDKSIFLTDARLSRGHVTVGTVAAGSLISESEEAFERIYQGSQILAVWPLELARGKPWTEEVSMKVEAARPPEPLSHRR